MNDDDELKFYFSNERSKTFSAKRRRTSLNISNKLTRFANVKKLFL